MDDFEFVTSPNITLEISNKHIIVIDKYSPESDAYNICNMESRRSIKVGRPVWDEKQNIDRLSECTCDDDDIKRVIGSIKSDMGTPCIISAHNVESILSTSDPVIQITKQLIDDTYGKFVFLVNGHTPTLINIVTYITYSIKLVSGISDMGKGRNIELILYVLRKYIDGRSDIDDTNKTTLHDIIERTLPVIYNTFVDGGSMNKYIKLAYDTCMCCKR